MADKPATLRRPLASRLLPRNRGTQAERALNSEERVTPAERDEKLVRRYVAWLRKATPKQRDVFIERFICGIQTPTPSKAVKAMVTINVLAKYAGPVTNAHSLVCNKNGPCDVCEAATIGVPQGSGVCCHRGPDSHSVVFN